MSKPDPKEEVLKVIEAVAGPRRMSTREYVNFLDNLIEDLEMRKEAAENDLEPK